MLYTDSVASSIYRRRVIQQAIFEELCEMLNPGKKPYTPKKGKPNVIMFVGLQLHDQLLASARFSNRQRWSILAAHSSLAADEQRRIFMRPPRGVRKVV